MSRSSPSTAVNWPYRFPRPRMEMAASGSSGARGSAPTAGWVVLVTKAECPIPVVPSGPRRGPHRRDAAARRRRGTARGRGAARRVAVSLDAVEDQRQRLVVGVHADRSLERLQRPRDAVRVVGLQLQKWLAGGHLL